MDSLDLVILAAFLLFFLYFRKSSSPNRGPNLPVPSFQDKSSPVSEAQTADSNTKRTTNMSPAQQQSQSQSQSQSQPQVTSTSRDILELLTQNNKNYLVLYTTQTGTSETYARQFSRELAVKFGLNVLCINVESVDFDSLTNLPPEMSTISIFASTYGEGEFPEDAVQFEEFMDTLVPDELSHLRFTLFGFGNSSYENYNAAAKKILKCFTEAGATLVGKFGMADDALLGTDEDYLAWKDDTLDELRDRLQLHEANGNAMSVYCYTVLDSKQFPNLDTVSLGEPSLQYLPCNELPFNKEKGLYTGPFGPKFPYVAPIIRSRELFSEKSGRNCIHVEFDISGSNMKYSTGDYLVVLPSNPNEKVEQFLDTFGLNRDEIFELTARDPTTPFPFPFPTTVGAVVRYYMEITGPISRQFFGMLTQFTSDESIKQKIQRISKNKDCFHREITSQYFNIADAVLYLTGGKPWTNIPFEHLIENVPKIKPRYYSISSSALSEKQTIHITAVVENEPLDNLASGTNDTHGEVETTCNRHVYGITTNLFRDIQLHQSNDSNTVNHIEYDLEGPHNLYSNYKLPIYIKRSTFKLPTNPRTPVLMVGPGTGVAPFRGFIRERVKYLELQADSNVKLGKHLLFYGCRNESDFLYKDEWPVYAKSLGDAFEMHVAHSRVPGEKKVYVQDLMKEHTDEIFQLLMDGGFIYVCGDAKGMARDVHQTFVEILAQKMQILEEDAAEMIKMFRTAGRYQEDIW